MNYSKAKSLKPGDSVKAKNSDENLKVVFLEEPRSLNKYDRPAIYVTCKTGKNCTCKCNSML